MNRRFMVLLALSVFAVAQPAKGQVYTGTVLYSLNLPEGDSFTTDPVPQITSGGQAVGQDEFTNHALLWTGAGEAVDLNPSDLGFTLSAANGTNGSQQVGVAFGNGIPTSAVLWNGTAASAVDLNPTNLSGISESFAYSTSGNQQVGSGVGSGTAPDFEHALLWTGTAASAVDLNPAGFSGSYAWGTDGTQQVGSGGGSGTGNNAHALLWSGTSASAVDLNPTNLGGVLESFAYGVSGAQQVGYAYGLNHALLWNGTAASVVDLNPAGSVGSKAYGTNGVQQVGEGGAGAMLWSGTAGSAVTLQSLLPLTGTWGDSTAYTINAAGDVFGTAYGTFNRVEGEFAVEWTPVPGSVPGPVSWATATDGSWANAPSWSAPNVPDSIIGVNFNTGSATPYTVTLGVSSSANSIDVQDNVTIQKAGFNLAVPGAVTIAGTVGQHASLTLAGAGLGTFGSLSITNGQLDVTDNMVVVNYGFGNPTPVGSIGVYVASGYNGGAWNGVGIVSSTVASVNAANGNPHLYGVGYADASDPAVAAEHFTPGTVVIEPAIVGDANLDGVVNYTDFQLLAANFNGVGTSWDEGNFNYGTGTNYTDFQLLAANFNDSTSLDAAEFSAMNQFAEKFGDGLVANGDGVGFAIVPEPASLGLLALAGVELLGRRVRRTCRTRGAGRDI